MMYTHASSGRCGTRRRSRAGPRKPPHRPWPPTLPPRTARRGRVGSRRGAGGIGLGSRCGCGLGRVGSGRQEVVDGGGGRGFGPSGLGSTTTRRSTQGLPLRGAPRRPLGQGCSQGPAPFSRGDEKRGPGNGRLRGMRCETREAGVRRRETIVVFPPVTL
jgi:hypothetical protein